jgi:hypothetical protein
MKNAERLPLVNPVRGAGIVVDGGMTLYPGFETLSLPTSF